MTEVTARVFLVILVYIVVASHCATRDSSCVTPNGENARCIPIKSCQVIKDAILTKSTTAINFAKASQCGYDRVPLVCCGSTGYPESTPNIAVTPLNHVLLPDSSVCGIQIEHDKIIGGRTTDIDEYPWLVLLSYTDAVGDDAGFLCGGSLINNRYVLTAAHCITGNRGRRPKSVRLGEWRISTTTDCLNTGECAEPSLDVEIESTVLHPDYSSKKKANDIGLIRMQRNIAYTDFIRPICLPSPNSPFPEAGSQLTVAGWGATENSSSSDIKLKLDVPLVSQTDCVLKYAKRSAITEFQVCAGGVAGKDSCQGDSGGPLMRTVFGNSPEGIHIFLEGIISWGVGCGYEGFPGVYTRVSKYATWISSNMETF